MTTQYDIHPLAKIFPEIEGKALDALVEDINNNGQQSPAALYEGKILDGKNRYRACEQLGKELMVREYDGKDPIGFVLSINLHRRHLDTSQRAMVAASLANLKVGTNRFNKKNGTSIEVASELLNVGRASVERAKIILGSGDADLIKSVQAGEVTVSEAAVQVQQQQEVQEQQGTQQQSSNDNTGSNTVNASDRYDKAEENLIKKLQGLSVDVADASAKATVKLLNSTVAKMKADAKSAKAA